MTTQTTISYASARKRTAEIKRKVIPLLEEQKAAYDADSSDPLNKARSRGVEARIRMLRDEFPSCILVSADEVANVWNLTFGVNHPIKREEEILSEVIRFDFETGEYLYPVWQFDHPSGILPGLYDVLDALREEQVTDAHSQNQFFFTKILWINHQSPIEFLSEGGDPQEIVDLILNSHLEQGWNN